MYHSRNLRRPITGGSANCRETMFELLKNNWGSREDPGLDVGRRGAKGADKEVSGKEVTLSPAELGIWGSVVSSPADFGAI